VTKAADRFTDAILATWDADMIEATAEKGYLALPDDDALRVICAETGDDRDTAEAEVVAWCVENRNARKATA
jgi:hypothetical protein